METAPRHRSVRIGCTFVQVTQVPTATVFQVEPIADGPAQISNERWSSEPAIDTHEYRDLYGNRCRRLTLPPDAR